MAELPQGWRLTTFRKLGWSDVLGLDDDALAFKGGTTWVSLRSTGLVTMQGNPISEEHHQALAYLKSLAPSGAKGTDGARDPVPGVRVVAVTEPAQGGGDWAALGRASTNEKPTP
jgi:hypothetical protein